MPEITIPDDLQTVDIAPTEPAPAPDNGLRYPDGLIDQMPRTIRQYLRYAAPSSDAPDEFYLMPFLSMLGSLIAKNRFVRVGPLTIYPIIWTVIFAQSSTFRKSTALSIAKSFYKPITNKWKDTYDKHLASWKAEKAQAQTEKNVFSDPEPIRRSLFAPDGFSDLTFWQALRDNGNMVSVSGEFTGLWGELTRSRNALTDVALQIFDADDIRRNTIAGGDIYLESPIWCIAGATTIPAFQKALSSTERGSGLLQRILPVTIIEHTKPFKALTELPAPDTITFNQICDKIDHLSNLSPRELNLSPEASRLYTKWSHDLNDRGRKLENEIDDIGGYLTRLNTYGLKFALIFQTIDDDFDDISGANMNASIVLCEWLLVHQIFMLKRNYIFNRAYADRLKIRDILKKQGGITTRTKLMTLSNFDREQLDRAINNDIESGHVEQFKIDTSGRPRFEYRLRPGADV